MSTAAPSLSLTSRYILRGVPALLLFHGGRLALPSHRWPRALEHLQAQLEAVTGMRAVEWGEQERWVEAEETEEAADDEEEDWEVLYDLSAELDVGLVCGVLAMTLVHWLHRSACTVPSYLTPYPQQAHVADGCSLMPSVCAR